MTVFVIDTNVIADIVNPTPNRNVVTRVTQSRQHTICLCEAVDYEVQRGYLKRAATSKLAIYQQRIVSYFQWTPILGEDWRQAARYWAQVTAKGKQLSDVDLLIAAVATRLNAVIVSNDDDFDALPVKRENWRE